MGGGGVAGWGLKNGAMQDSDPSVWYVHVCVCLTLTDVVLSLSPSHIAVVS